jgi:hypothetical protein
MATPKKKKAGKKLRAGRGQKGKVRSVALTSIQKQFLDALRELHEVTAAATATGMSRFQHYRWIKRDPYKAAFEVALKEAKDARADSVFAEIHKAGHEGWDVEIVEEERALRTVPDGEGGLVERLVPVKQRRRITKQRSVTALIWEGNHFHGNPARLELTGKDGGPIPLKLSVEQLRELAGL